MNKQSLQLMQNQKSNRLFDALDLPKILKDISPCVVGPGAMTGYSCTIKSVQFTIISTQIVLFFDIFITFFI